LPVSKSGANERSPLHQGSVPYLEDTVLTRTVDADDTANAINIPSMSLLDLVLNSLQDDKAEDIVTIDLKGNHQLLIIWS